MTREIILVVEDNDVTRRGLQIMLDAAGYSVITAIHGIDAIQKMEDRRPDLILCDIAMPEMDGYAFFDEVRRHPEWVALPFIFLTALGKREDRLAGKRLGVEDYLVKPVDRHELLACIRSRLNRSREILLAQLQHAYESSLIMLANVIEVRDRYTRGHVERVMAYSITIGRVLGLNNEQIVAVQLGSILHDIGKIYIREIVLHKPGPLDDEEWDSMERHPVVGADLIRNIPYLAPAIPVIRHHHERWDGQGYPDKLCGEEIPLTARIVAVADSLDAMTSDRVYQVGRSFQDAYDEILRCSGSAYDPVVVNAFQSAWDDIEKQAVVLNSQESFSAGYS